MRTQLGNSIRFGVGVAVAAAVAVPPVGWAQVAGRKAATKMEMEIEEITVTAQKREENIQETPISVTAVTGAALEEQGIPSLMELGQSVPNMRLMSTSSGEATVQVSMRGTFSGETSLVTAPSVGFHIDGFYLAKNLGNNMDLEDLERVEVLRGPQGTLFGRNTTGGAINLVTKKPTEQRSITLSTDVGNYDAVKERLTVNVPLIGKNGFFQSDALGTLSLRENAVYRSHEPYVDNRTPPGTNIPANGTAGFNNTNRVFNLTALRWQPIKEVTVDYAFEYHRYRDSIAAAQISYIYPGSLVDAGSILTLIGALPPGGLVPYLQPNRVSSMGTTAVYANDKSLHRPSFDGNNRIHMLTTAWELGDLGPLGSVTLKSISGYRNMAVNNNNAFSGSPLHILDFTDQQNLETWSQELQMIGTAPRLHYVLGGYYYGEHTTDVDEQTIFGDLPTAFGGATVNRSRNTGTVEAWAPFGQVTVTPPILHDKLSITAGLRFSYEHVRVKRDYRSGTFAAGLTPVPGFPATTAGSFGVHGVALPGLSPMANIAYQWTDETMTYFKVSRGFQSGTVNGRAGTSADFSRLVEPETLVSYEGGVKSQWLEKRLRLNVGGFLSEYTNQLVQVINPDPTQRASFITLGKNVGSSEFWGFELEAVALPLRGVEASLNYSYLNTRYLEWVEATGAFDANGNPVMANRANQKDVPHAPDNTITAGLTYTAPPTSTGVFSVHVDGSWVDSTVTSINRPIVNGVEHDPISTTGNYALFNARLQFVDIPLQKGSLDISAYCHNLADRNYRSYGIDLGSQLGYMVSSFGDPRTFGLQLTYNFTAS